MASGYELSAQDLKQRLSQVTGQWRQLMGATRDLLQRFSDYGPVAIQAAYFAANPQNPAGAQADVVDLQAAEQAMADIINFAVYGSEALTRADNTTATAAGSAETVSVPAGAYAVVSADPTLIALLKSVGVDKGPAIRKPSPLSVGPS